MGQQLSLPPTGPGSLTRQTFALTNKAAQFITVVLDQPPETRPYLRVWPEIVGLEPDQSVVVSVGVAFPQDALSKKERYGFRQCENSTQGVQTDDELIFRVNGSSSTTVKVRLTAVCSGLDIAMEKVGENEPVIQERWPAEPGPVRVAMAPVSLGSEATRLFTLQNRGLTPVRINARPAVESEGELLRVTPGATLVRGCEIFECGFVLSALERRFRGAAREAFVGRVELSAEVPRQFCVPTPKSLIGVGNYQN